MYAYIFKSDVAHIQNIERLSSLILGQLICKNMVKKR